MKRVFFLLIVFIAVQLVTSAGVFVVGTFLHLEVGETNRLLLPWASLISSLLMAVVVLLTHSVPFRRRTFWLTSPKVVGLCAPMVLTALIALSLFFELCPLPDWNEDAFLEMSQSPWGLLSIAVVAPLVEELLFRGAIEGHLLRIGKSPKMAIGVSAVLFGIVHGNPAQIPFAILVGILLGWCYYRTGSLLPGFLYHLINNTLAVCTFRYAPDLSLVDTLGGRTATWCVVAGCLCLFIASLLWARKCLPQADASRW